jgi:transposase InsO family protein
MPTATIHREVADAARKMGQEPPSYKVVRAVVGELEPALVTLAHEGSKAYSESFDLVRRHEADAPNASWQADHTELDILVKDADGTARRPWLTIIIDDYSRAVAGYFLSLSAPSAIQTALALRQAIWRKSQPGWHVCGIPQVLYSDHGSDFTSRHLEQVSADLKIRLINSTVARPRGRGKIERFFDSLAPTFDHMISLGQSNTIVSCPAFTTHSELDESSQRKAGITPTTIRFAVGDEDPRDLIAHFIAATKLAIDPAVPNFSAGFAAPEVIDRMLRETYLDVHKRYIESKPAFRL